VIRAKALQDISPGDVQITQEQYEAAIAKIEALKQTFVNHSMVPAILAGIQTMAADNPQMQPFLPMLSVDALKTLSWGVTTPETTMHPMIVSTILSAVQTAATTSGGPIATQLENTRDALNAITKSAGFAAYESIVNESLNTINTNLEQVNAAIVETEKGQLTAAIEFANANAAITLGQFQIDAAKTQIDATKEQLDAGKEQLDAAQEQIDEGRKQLEEARKSAYTSAELGGILTVDLVKSLLTAQNFAMPAGYVTEDGVDYLVRVGDKPESLEDLSGLALIDLHMDGVPVITLGDVAEVFYTDNSADIYTNVNGSAGVILTLQKQTGYSTGEVSDLLAARFERLTEKNPDLSMITLMDQGIYIDLVMNSILSNVLFGGALAILILIAFLKDLRPTLVVAISIPVSVVTAIVCMYFSGVTLNVISLSGLALGIGMLVDNSIVVIENIYRMRSEGAPMRTAAIEGAKEVAGAIIASTLTTICVFLPIVFTEGITRQLFVDMGLTIAYSLLASLLIALTVVPAMASVLLTKTKEKKEGKLYRGFVNGYAKLLEVSLRVKPLVFLLVLILLVSSILLSFSKGTAFMPDMDSTQLTVNITMPEGSTMEETGDVTDDVVNVILQMEEVEDVGAMASSSNLSLLGGGGAADSTQTVVYVVLKEDKSTPNEEIGERIKELTTDLPAEISVNTATMDMSALGGSGISINIEGRDLDTLQQIAKQVAAIIEGVEGTQDVSDGFEDAGEELRILVDREKAAQVGLTVAQVFQQVYAKLATATSATTLEAPEKDYPVYVEDGEDTVLTRELLKEVEIDGTNADGEAQKYSIQDIAEFGEALTLSAINRSNQTRYVSVSAGIAPGYNVGLVSTQVSEELDNYTMPEGYQLVFAGENEMINDAMEQVWLMMLLAVIFIYLIMVAQFQSLLSPFIIMFTIPLAFTGGFAGLYFSNSPVSIVASIGFVMLAGIIVNNCIVLIDYINQLRERGVSKKEAILEAGRTRLRPVLMTALTTILAMSTMVFSSDMGAEMAKPMAVVTIGGLLYGTLLTLIVIPCIYDLFHRKEKRVPKD
jgi:multidrug efflux pump subunit AcrB